VFTIQNNVVKRNLWRIVRRDKEAPTEADVADIGLPLKAADIHIAPAQKVALTCLLVDYEKQYNVANTILWDSLNINTHTVLHLNKGYHPKAMESNQGFASNVINSKSQLYSEFFSLKLIKGQSQCCCHTCVTSKFSMTRSQTMNSRFQTIYCQIGSSAPTLLQDYPTGDQGNHQAQVSSQHLNMSVTWSQTAIRRPMTVTGQEEHRLPTMPAITIMHQSHVDTHKHQCAHIQGCQASSVVSGQWCHLQHSTPQPTTVTTLILHTILISGIHQPTHNGHANV
jgi:hypothetical protein